MNNFKQALKLLNMISKTLKFFNFEGTSLPGKIIQKFYPNFLYECDKVVRHPRFAITGTNGKTTTTGILSEILYNFGLDVISNKLGANMPNGIVTSIANGLYNNLNGGAVIECDEAYFSVVSNKFTFDYLLITNLFRDQLDRYGEMDIARKKIIKGIELNPDIKVVLNADDPSLFEITEKLNYKKDKFVFFGVNNVIYQGYEKNSNSPCEGLYCAKCGGEILYKEKYYAQLGDWYCRCSNARPKLDVEANIIVYQDKSTIEAVYKNNKYTFNTNLTGLYNAYNVLGAIACAFEYGISADIIQKALKCYSPVFGRHQKIKLKNGGNLTIHLIKNPVGASEVLRGLKNIKNSKMLISINDNYADGRDVSWLWDTDFEALKDFESIIYTTGTRSFDMALRMKYAGFNKNLLEVFDNTGKISKTASCVLSKLKEGENLVILVTYTGLLEINANMDKLIKKYGA